MFAVRTSQHLPADLPPTHSSTKIRRSSIRSAARRRSSNAAAPAKLSQATKATKQRRRSSRLADRGRRRSTYSMVVEVVQNLRDLQGALARQSAISERVGCAGSREFAPPTLDTQITEIFPATSFAPQMTVSGPQMTVSDPQMTVSDPLDCMEDGTHARQSFSQYSDQLIRKMSRLSGRSSCRDSGSITPEQCPRNGMLLGRLSSMCTEHRGRLSHKAEQARMNAQLTKARARYTTPPRAPNDTSYEAKANMRKLAREQLENQSRSRVPLSVRTPADIIRLDIEKMRLKASSKSGPMVGRTSINTRKWKSSPNPFGTSPVLPSI